MLIPSTPKSLSAKIRRVQVRASEVGKHPDADAHPAGEFHEEDPR